jgi:hypothetical protein
MINTFLFGLSQKNRDKFSSVKEQAFNLCGMGLIGKATKRLYRTLVHRCHDIRSPNLNVQLK